VIGRRVERRRAVERGNQFTAVVERPAIAATSDTVNTRDGAACRAPRPVSRREATTPGQTTRPDARRAIQSWPVASRLPPYPPAIIENLVTTYQISSNLVKSWRLTAHGCRFAEFCQDLHASSMAG
jgi:hypothetical protein